jgi:uncharacterized protein
MVAIQGMKPPERDHDSAGFWSALEDGHLEISRCEGCGHFSFPPMPACPHCGVAGLTGVDAAGTAVVYSWVTVHVALDAAFEADVPYSVVIAELDEGPRVIGRFLGESSELGPDVKLRFVPYEVAGTWLPGFVADDDQTPMRNEGDSI